MKRSSGKLLLTFFLFLSYFFLNAQNPYYSYNKAPLVPQKYVAVPLGKIKPEGWLKTQLEQMKKGSTGHLDEYYPKVKNENGWLGGKGDGWEETPYWLDGAVPLAYLLDDKELKDKVLKYINWTIQNQRPNGYFGPVTKSEREGKPFENCQQGEDWWPKMVMLKVMQQYYSATNDQKVISFMSKYFQYQYNNLKACPLGKWTEWSQARGQDNILTIYWLYNHTGDKYLLELADMVNHQSTPWTKLLGGRDWVIQAAVNQTSEKWMERHAVNVGMGIKMPAIYYQSQGKTVYLDSLKTGWKDLMSLHGLPHGMFSGDEDLHGNDPTQGVELCAIVETMYSLEEIVGITGDQAYMEALERMTFNALPTQTTDDFMSRQYFQIANQVQVSRGVYDFSLPFSRGMNNVFGHYAGYTCCTANMHQGWTKFAANLWYSTPGKGLAALVYSPNTVKAKVADGTEVTIKEETAYPFGNKINFTISTPKTLSFPMEFRIPEWCKEAAILLNGKLLRTEKGGQIITIERAWVNRDQLTLDFPMEIRTSNWARNSRAVERGPLVYALKIEETWTQKEIKEEGIFYEIQPASDWNYGLLKKMIDKPSENASASSKPLTGEYVWNSKNAPVSITLKGKKIPNWKLVEGVARQPVTTREEIYQGEVSQEEETITLIPYGCTKLRIVAFPVVK